MKINLSIFLIIMSGFFTGVSKNPSYGGSAEDEISVDTLTRPVTVAEARNLPQGTPATVSGWVTVSDHFSGPVYFQDETAGMAFFYDHVMRDSEQGFTLDLSIGDSIVVTGPVTEFNGLIQIAPAGEDERILFQIYPEGRREIRPLTIALHELKTGAYESRLVRIDDVHFQETGRFSGDTNYRITDSNTGSEVRISHYTDIPGMKIPPDPVQITGVAGRFRDTVQLLPRSRDDFLPSGDAPLIISDLPYESEATPTSVTLSWQTSHNGTSEIRYGLSDDYEIGIVEDDEYKSAHTLTIDGLKPATVYHIQLRSARGTDTTRTSDYLVSTASPAAAGQDINVYFNRDADHTLATYENATESYDFSRHLIDRIGDAAHSLDLAFYSISGEVAAGIAGAVTEARERDVEIRVILDHNTATDDFMNALLMNGIPVIESNFGSGNRNRDGLHHNKFAIIDYRGGEPDDVWLITSSWNATDSGTFDHYQNMIEFQDVAIAGAYTREFNQMWGSKTTVPDSTNALFGNRKKVVNPTVFRIGDSMVQLYFSPQGDTETAIVNTLRDAEHTINLGTMLITRPEITNTLFKKHTGGVTVRGVKGQPWQRGSQFNNIAAFADMHHLSASEFGLLHHKYAIIDGESSTRNGVVITGSHNWTAAANHQNDENTVIIHDDRIANLYLQEFAARYRQAGGEDHFHISNSGESGMQKPLEFRIHQNAPNPFNPSTVIRFQMPSAGEVKLEVFDVLGRQIAVLADHHKEAGIHEVTMDASHLATGIYIYRIQLEEGRFLTRAMTLVK